MQQMFSYVLGVVCHFQCNVLWSLLNISAHSLSWMSSKNALYLVQLFVLHLCIFSITEKAPHIFLAPKGACALLLTLVCLEKAEMSPEMIQMSTV